MLNIFKKPDEEPNDGKLTATEQSQNLEETIKEENPSEEMNTQELCQNREENILSLLETLGGEEMSLEAEKLQLINMEETLKQKIRDEIEIKRHANLSINSDYTHRSHVPDDCGICSMECFKKGPLAAL